MRPNRWEAGRMAHVAFSGIRAVSEAARELAAQGKKVVDLSIGRPDFDTPAHIKEAAKRALDKGMVHYTTNYGLPGLLQALADKLERDNGVTYDPEGEIIVTIGAAEAVAATMLAFLEPGRGY